jgi:hypothetical protein
MKPLWASVISVINYMELSKEIIRLLWNPKIPYCDHNSPPLDSTLSNINPDPTLAPCSFTINFNIILPPAPTFLKLLASLQVESRVMFFLPV